MTLQYRQRVPVPEEPEERLSVPYSLEAGSRHDRVLNRLLEREQDRFPTIDDQSDKTFGTAEDRQDAFKEIVADGVYGKQVLVKEFYLFDPAVEWREETAIELDLARFVPETRTVYCIETTGKNLECVRGEDEDEYLTREERRERVRKEAWEKGKDQIDELQGYMERFGWSVEGRIAAFYQDGKRSEAEVEIYTYTPEVDA